MHSCSLFLAYTGHFHPSERGGFGLNCSSARGVNAAAAMIWVVPHLKIPGMLEQERASLLDLR